MNQVIPTNPSSSVHRFWRVRNSLLAGDAAAILARGSDTLDHDAVVCAPMDMGLHNEAWLESEGEGPRFDVLHAFCVQHGLEVVDALSGVLITERHNPTNEHAPTHRLYLHYVADAESIAILDAWYLEEHEEMLLRSPHWNRIRRFSVDDEPPFVGHLVVHDISDPHVLASAELRDAMDTRRRSELARLEWFGRSSRSPWRILRTPPTDLSTGCA